MSEYRVYLMDGRQGIVAVHTVICNDDENAIIAARPFARGHEIEIWDGARKVARLKQVHE